MNRQLPRSTLFPYTTLFRSRGSGRRRTYRRPPPRCRPASRRGTRGRRSGRARRSEEHTSELQSLTKLVCRLLLEKKTTHEKWRHDVLLCRLELTTRQYFMLS